MLADLEEAVALVRAYLAGRGVHLEDIAELTGFARNHAIVEAKEAVNESDETRKRFEIMAREVFRKFKACLTVEGVRAFRPAYDAVNIIYKSLQQDVEKAEVTDIIRELHRVVDRAVALAPERSAKPREPYDISKIDFDRLRREFENVPSKNTTVQSLKSVVQQKLHRMMQQNPLRTGFQKRYEEIVDAYNHEKDRLTIEQTFEDLLKLAESLDEEEHRAVREGLDEESLALYDLLVKPELDKKETARIKKVAAELIETIHSELEGLEETTTRARSTRRPLPQTASST